MRPDIRYNNIIDSDEARKAQAEADRAPSLPAERIDADRFYITQHYHLYTRENHDVWREMFDRRWGVLEGQVSRQFIEGLKILRLTRDRIPLLDDLVLDRDIEIAGGARLAKGARLDGINRFLQAQSDWASYGVPGYLPAKAFFACLAQREFPTTVLIRPREVMDYLPEPDIFHDVFGHIPMHANREFGDFLQAYGEAALHCGGEPRLTELQRLFWFTVEFGLIREEGRLRLYGSGLISSPGEGKHCLESPAVERVDFDLERVIAQDFEIDHYQPLLFVIDSYEQLFAALGEYRRRLLH